MTIAEFKWIVAKAGIPRNAYCIGDPNNVTLDDILVIKRIVLIWVVIYYERGKGNIMGIRFTKASILTKLFGILLAETCCGLDIRKATRE